MEDPTTFVLKIFRRSVYVIVLISLIYFVNLRLFYRSIAEIVIPSEYSKVTNCWIEVKIGGLPSLYSSESPDINTFWFGLPVSSIKIIEYLEDEGGVRYRRYFWGIPLDTKVYDC